MSIQTVAMRNLLANAYAAAAVAGAAYTTAPGGSAGTEPSGGSPAYARKTIPWGTASASVVTGTVTIDIPSGATIVGVGVHSALTTGTYYDGVTTTSQPYASQGTLAVTYTYTQT